MGNCYYLARDDNRTLYELGKHTGDWEDVLGCGNPIWLIEPTADIALALEVVSLEELLQSARLDGSRAN